MIARSPTPWERCIVACVAFVVAASLTGRVRADDTPPTGASVDLPLGAEGDPLHRALDAYANHQFAEARAWFLLAYEREPNARALRGLGVVCFALGEYVEAMAYLRASLVHTVRPLDEPLRQRVLLLLDETRQHVGEVVFEAIPPLATVRVDGVRVALDETGRTFVVPGRRSIMVDVEGLVRLDTMLDIDAGATRTLVLDPSDESTAHGQDGPAEVAPIDDVVVSVPLATRPEHRRRRVVLSTLLGGGTLAATGATLYFVAWSRHGHVVDTCRDGCLPSQVDSLYASERIVPLKHAGVVLMAAGAVSAVAGVVVRLALPDEERRGSIGVGPTSVLWRRRF